jgi:mRNA interferase RelE/StbE
MSYAIQILPAAQRAMADLPKPVRRRVDEHILLLANDPRPHGEIPLKGEGKRLWRLRLGDYRILYQVRDGALIVLVIDIASRREVYPRL